MNSIAPSLISLLLYISYADALFLPTPPKGATLKQATLGGGCFWCVQGCMTKVRGVYNVVSGYSGGHVHNPTYEQTKSGETGHAEVVTLQFIPDVISYKDVLRAFFKSHDPTLLNKQNDEDVGTMYRSIILYHDDSQLNDAQEVINELNSSTYTTKRIVTELKRFEVFYPAEEYHQHYYEYNPDVDYVKRIVLPKIEKFDKIIRSGENKDL